MTSLFEVSPGDVADTTDDWYTPPWLFKAAGLTFDMDVAAPVDPARRTCPARAYLTPVEDGLTHFWQGIIWCNPPYSNPEPWVDRFCSHPAGLLLVPAVSAMWVGRLMSAVDRMTLIRCEFGRARGAPTKPGNAALILAARGGECAAGLALVAMADKYANGAYLSR